MQHAPPSANLGATQSTSGSPTSATLASVEHTTDELNRLVSGDGKSPVSTDDEKTLSVYPNAVHKTSFDGSVVGSREEAEFHIVTGLKFYLIFTGMMLSIFLVTLDQTILATAIPKISSDFDALEQQTWIASAYFLTQSGFILTYGQLLAVANTKWIYLIAVSIFEIGSIICGAAPGMNVLIFGRALAGVGAAGIFVTTLCILARITRIQQRALLFGLFGAVFALSSVIGPLLGGVFTDHVSWRWCFFINIPFGIITIVTILLFIKREHSAPPANPSVPEWKRIMQIDWIGCLLSIGIITALLLPLQWGGVTKSWSDNMGVAYGREGRHATVNVEELDSNRVLRVRVLQHAYPLDLYLLSSSVLPKLRGEIRNIERNRNHHVHGGAIGIAIAGTIFGNQLTSSMAKYAPNLSSSIVLAVRQSVNVIYTLPVEDKANVIRAYSESLGAQAQA
ncbi:hypothetical protein FRB96_000516 [Tulasnella sp. 330]|nr:hypothetical protein FRB96_000516 [Tulasnella sp. 330]